MEILSCSLCVSRLVGALALCRCSGARLAQWRPSVLSLPLVFSLCTCALLLNIHLDSCDRTRAISFKQVISTAPSSTQKELKTMSEEERVTAKSRRMMSLIATAPSTLSSSASESPVKKAMKVRVPGVRKLRKMIEQGNPLSTVTCTQHNTQGGMMTKLGLLKSGKLTNRWMMERSNPL